MNVVYSSSDSYSEICGISIVSLLENNKETDEIHIFIIDNDISEKNRILLRDSVVKYNRTLTFVDKINVEEITNTSIYVGRWNIGTFFRLYLSSILPLNVDRVIYLDCDTIIRHSLEEIYNLDLGEYLVAGVDDCRSNLYRLDIGCNPNTVYINNGFMVINLKAWREKNIESKFTSFIESRGGNLTYMDQAPLNAVLGPQNLIYELPAVYNAQRIFFDFTYRQLLKVRKPQHHLSEIEYNNAISNPIIVHFTPVFISGTRPWNFKDNHKFRKEYIYYKSLSLWKNTPFRKDDRKLWKKLMTFICKILPKFILLPIMGYLHAYWYPKKRMKINRRFKK